MKTKKLLTVGSCCAIAAASMAAFAGTSLISYTRSSSETQVRQMVSDAFVYVADNNGQFPDSPMTFAKTIDADVEVNASRGACMKASAPGTFSYNIRLAGLDRDDVRDPARTVLVYEGRAEHVAFQHAGKAIVAFVDGHVEEVTPHQAMLLRWMP